LPRISTFPKDEKNWQIDWFGEIAFPNRLIRRKQPSVLVYLSRIISDRYEDDPTVLLSPNRLIPHGFNAKFGFLLAHYLCCALAIFGGMAN
jgi:hypothetical protein